MNIQIVPTYTIWLYIAGDIEEAKMFLRRESYPPQKGLCVTVEPVTFIYTGGEEIGLRIGFLNYPRFPEEPDDLLARATSIAERLIQHLCQWTALLVAPDKTVWLNCRPDLEQS